jgi:hypothetical protein
MLQDAVCALHTPLRRSWLAYAYATMILQLPLQGCPSVAIHALSLLTASQSERTSRLYRARSLLYWMCPGVELGWEKPSVAPQALPLLRAPQNQLTSRMYGAQPLPIQIRLLKSQSSTS